MNTSCKNCVFAEWENNTQVYCQLNRIEKFRNQGIVVDEAYDEDNREFYVIKSVCLANRTNKWASRQNTNLIDKVYNEMQIKVDCIIYIDSRHNIYDIESTYNSVLLSKLKPLNITFLVNTNNIHQYQITSFINPNNNVSWRIEKIVEDTNTSMERSY